MLRKYLLGASVIVITISSALAWSCGADSKAVPLKDIDLPKRKLRSLQAAAFTPLEIFYDYTTLDAQSYPAETKANIKQLLTEAKGLFKAIIRAKKLEDMLSLGDAECDQDISISQVVRSPGVNAHMIIFPFIDPAAGANVLAYASACLTISNYRPVAGLIGFSFTALNFQVENWFDYYLSLVMHELTHALVFSSGLFRNYVDANDKVLTTPVTKTSTVNGVTRTLLITPKVVQAARTHYNCSTLEGVELENQGGSGTAGSHWEARIMLTDYMIGSNYDENTISDISLALFEDSGWYQVNYYTGGLFRFGKNQGCSFLNSKCLEDAKSSFKNEFCDENNMPFCTNGRLSRGFCYISSQTVPSQYNYFPVSNKGGYSLADFCPVSRVVTDASKYLNWNCKYGDVASENANLGETLSDSSLCFMSTLSPPSMSVSKPSTICYPIKCNFATSTYTVTVLEQEIVCPAEGGTQTNASLKGELTCAHFNEVCTSETPCYDIKSCIDNKSVSAASKSYESTTQTPTPEKKPTVLGGSVLKFGMSTFMIALLFL